MSEFVRGMMHVAAATLTRPNNTTPYGAGQAMAAATSGATPLVFPKAARYDGEGAIVIQATCVDGANQATKPDLELWLFDAPPAGTINDGVAFAPTAADAATLVGTIAFASTAFRVGNAASGASGNCFCDVQNVGIGVPRGSATAQGDLYGVLVVRNAYTPVANEVFTIRLKVAD